MSKTNFGDAVVDDITDALASHINDIRAAINNIEAAIGMNVGTETASIPKASIGIRSVDKDNAPSLLTFFQATGSPKSKMLVQGGESSVDLGSSSGGILNFPSPFPNGLLTIVITNSTDRGDIGGSVNFNIHSRSSSGITFYATLNDWATKKADVSLAGKRVHFNWIAIGW